MLDVSNCSRLTETGVLMRSQASRVKRCYMCYFSVTSFSISICTVMAEPNAFEQYDKSSRGLELRMILTEEVFLTNGFILKSERI